MDAEPTRAPAAELVLRLASPEATEALGEALGARLVAGELVLLDGELGAGKTTFVRGLARGLGVRAPVRSPTYTLLASHAGRVPLHHFDAYLEGRERALLEESGLEALGGDGVAAVEWAERVLDLLPPTRLRLRLEHLGPSERRLALAVEGAGPAAGRLHGLLPELARAAAGLEGVCIEREPPPAGDEPPAPPDVGPGR